MSNDASSEDSATERIGFVGLGTMGSLMALNLARAALPLTVWNRTPGRASALVANGAREASSPSDLATTSDIIVLCVTDSPQVEEVLFGHDGIARGARPGALVIDCSTISPTQSLDFANRLREHGIGMLDAPVSGGSEGARLATLTIMVGGEVADFERAQGVLSHMGSSINHLGAHGAGQWAKAINQIIIAGTYLGVAEGITLALKAGLDVAKVVQALVGGAAQSWVLSNRSTQMITNDYPLGFRISLHRKDLDIGLELAREVGAVLPVTALASAFEDGIVAQGHGDDDISALARPIRRLAGLE